jgi:hypothetical protein
MMSYHVLSCPMILIMYITLCCKVVQQQQVLIKPSVQRTCMAAML